MRVIEVMENIKDIEEQEQVEPIVINGRPFTPQDLAHLDEIIELQKAQAPEPTPMDRYLYWHDLPIPRTPREIMIARACTRPITIVSPPVKKLRNNPPMNRPERFSITTITGVEVSSSWRLKAIDVINGEVRVTVIDDANEEATYKESEGDVSQQRADGDFDWLQFCKED